ncbi:ROK family transcriptional regulator [Sphingomonas sp.]|uniref:ROK family transcriptional regulator n=1 Tax=Sphingomonas sp. TaxID=28214 RepID=UPI003B3A3CF5
MSGPNGAGIAGRIGADDRSSRLVASLSGTNLERAADYNQRIVLQAIRVAGETTRSELARTSGLTPPTIANITNRLLDEGLIRRAGRRQGLRGQPALRLQIDPDGAFAIGLNIDRDHYTIVSLDLAGRVRTRAAREMRFAMPDEVIACLQGEIEAIRRAGDIDERKIIGVGVSLPYDLGGLALPHRPKDYGIWSELDVAKLVGKVLPWPVHIDNDAAAAALGEAQFGTGLTQPSFFYVLISAGLGGGLVVDGSYVRGANGRSGEIGFIPDLRNSRAGATIQDTVSLSVLLARLEAAGCASDDITALETNDAAATAVIERWLDDAADSLAAPLVSVNCLVDPAIILLGGRLPERFVDALAARLNDRLAGLPIPAVAPVARAITSSDAPAVGAAILPFLDRLLPNESALMQAGRD